MTFEQFITTLGCTVTVRDAPKSLGEGVLLSLAMKRPGDGRYAEVFLTMEESQRLRASLPLSGKRYRCGAANTSESTIRYGGTFCRAFVAKPGSRCHRHQDQEEENR